MLVAELRRKLPRIDDIDPNAPDVVSQVRGMLRETKEDLLTADVFGVLKYLPRRPYLEYFLAAVASRNPNCQEFQNLLPTMNQNVEEFNFEFWPSYPTPNRLSDGRTEPDVQIADKQVFLLVEAKLGSGFGERQIERELAVAANESNGREFFVIMVTPGSKSPRFRYAGRRLQIVDYLAAVGQAGELGEEACNVLAANANRVLWISWDSIQKALAEARESHRSMSGTQPCQVARATDMLDDLNALMLMRHIQPFEGFSMIHGMDCGVQFDDRPVLLDAPTIRNQDQFLLADAVRLAPQAFSWRCPASSAKDCAVRSTPYGISDIVQRWPIESPSGFNIERSKS